MNKKKIINDPVYGLISIPTERIFDILEHRIVQRLRNIKQLGLTHYVYPGAVHTRLNHALGAMHLMREAIAVLRSKGIEVTDEEREAACIAILLHDIGHGPFSHALEGAIVGVHHEQLTLALMEKINAEMNGALDLAINIFKGRYHKSFLHQLVSSQLDLDRMDYLKRDSFFTGVAEGAIGHDRIIKMLSVVNNDLVVEVKAIYSIEKFLMARTFMYYQVYLHKTVISVEQMLFRFIELLRREVEAGNVTCPSSPLQFFMTKRTAEVDLSSDEVLNNFINLDDADIMATIKYLKECDDPGLRFYSQGIADRRLLKVKLKKVPFESDLIEELRLKVVNTLHIPYEEAGSLVISGIEKSETYSLGDNEIKVLLKNGEVVALSSFVRRNLFEGPNITHFLCYPKFK